MAYHHKYQGKVGKKRPKHPLTGSFIKGQPTLNMLLTSGERKLNEEVRKQIKVIKLKGGTKDGKLHNA